MIKKMSFLSKPPLYNVFTSWKADNKCLVIDMCKYYPSMCSVYKAGTHDTKIKKTKCHCKLTHFWDFSNI